MRFLPAALFLLIFILLALPLLRAAENETELPPSVPTTESPIIARAVYSNGSPVQNTALVLLARSGKSDSIYRLITDSRGSFLLSLGKGAYELDALLDNPGTPGIDFASTATLSAAANSNLTMIFYPAGSLSGKVLQGGSPVPNARVRVSCPSNSFDYARINGMAETDAGEAGDFLFRALPVGTCTVSASTDSHAASSDFEVAHGKSSSTVLEMKGKAVEIDTLILVAVVAGGIAIILTALFFLRGRLFGGNTGVPMGYYDMRPSAPSSDPKKEGQPKAAASAQVEKEESKFALSNPKAKAVLATLSDREADIVKFLFKSNGKSKRSTMQHKLLIPKTSLLRNLRSLERKNIVKLTPFGRNLLAELDEQLFE